MNDRTLPNTRNASPHSGLDRYVDGWLRWLGYLRQLAYLVYEVGWGLASLKGHRRKYVTELIVHQVIFSGIDAVAIISAIALIVGGVVTVQLLAYFPGFRTDPSLIDIVTSLIVKEIAPILTALVLVGRSGSAITVELGQMCLKNQDAALAGMGINIVHYFHLPRIAGLTIAGLVLNLYFVLMAFFAWSTFSVVQHGTDLAKMAPLFFNALNRSDFLVCMLKGAAIGMSVAFVCIHQGLNIQGSATEIPQRVSKAVVFSFLASFVISMLISLAWYLLR